MTETATPPVEAGRRSRLRGRQSAQTAAEQGFSRSMLVSGTRCFLTYLVFPFLLPALGLAEGVGPLVGLVIGVVAIVFNVLSIKRFRHSDHRLKRPIITVNAAVIVLLVYLSVADVGDILG